MFGENGGIFGQLSIVVPLMLLSIILGPYFTR